MLDNSAPVPRHNSAVPQQDSVLPEEVTVVLKCRYCATTMQEAVNARVNGFALTLLAESLGDKDALVDGGVMFSFPHDHKGRRTWIMVTQRPPEIVFPDNEPEIISPEAQTDVSVTDDLGLRLTVRERKVLDLLARGEIPATIANILSISLPTVRHRIRQAYAKLGVHSRYEALRAYKAAKQRALLSKQKGVTHNG